MFVTSGLSHPSCGNSVNSGDSIARHAKAYGGSRSRRGVRRAELGFGATKAEARRADANSMMSISR
jgi:hypothetical protein